MQSFGIELLDIFDSLRSRTRRNLWRADTLRLALMIRDPKLNVTDLFPDWFPAKVVEAGSEEHKQALAAGAEEDLSGVTWQSPSSSIEDEWAEIQRQLANQRIDVNEGNRGGGGWV